MKIFSGIAHQSVPDISVVIPTYNRIHMLKEALDSVLQQNFNGSIEIFVVDDCSRDNTATVVKNEYPSVNLITLKQNSGVSVARNTGILQAKGRYITFLDSDDLWEPNYLETQFQAAQLHKDCFFASGIVNFDTVNNSKTIRWQTPDLDSFISIEHHLLVRGSCIYTPSSVLFPRNILDSVGLFDNSLRFGEDTDLYLRCLIQGYGVHFTKSPLVIRRKHNMGQATESKTLGVRKNNRLNLAKKYYPALKKKFVKIPSTAFNHICAEICMAFANKYFDEQYYLKWFWLSLETIKYGLPKFTTKHLIWKTKKLLY
ncbi:glycosyltransferase family 2 protein [Leptolyngbya cf. ectocarpi LEGE 11479]|uniref:Glycosyltransferase family 2 protein n=1 Tax=Leptolyngbya cf. ectocarpi LEGE 11479 TaxID=1828722 RepID=A0A928X1N3_LEPEC|nr:glycosyltransferase family A protein [Leptolyngbya ectocarpi]MBE9066260.1 glycosyltransferase family 2 protein [Leptolyngbya cf. ectocarpi LEGE 11479]